uniref:Uncharacterized protein n=1 Tax=Palpitomonas bilix TaxID=652834 RepID=A0A7S3DCD8_9EUKA|mmetsp:Transcript_31344/g.82120  ORF Transcript_31344/g.82120 Transcript_31344/m.82120 type:complete len:181 (+) Transcript_31344:182-724(+)
MARIRAEVQYRHTRNGYEVEAWQEETYLFRSLFCIVWFIFIFIFHFQLADFCWVSAAASLLLYTLPLFCLRLRKSSKLRYTSGVSISESHIEHVQLHLPFFFHSSTLFDLPFSTSNRCYLVGDVEKAVVFETYGCYTIQSRIGMKKRGQKETTLIFEEMDLSSDDAVEVYHLLADVLPPP